MIKDAGRLWSLWSPSAGIPTSGPSWVRIESPGGGVGASQEIYREVRRTDQEKPVVASLGGVAASGGYYVASGARYIIANPGTLTGSIGVVAHLPTWPRSLRRWDTGR